VDVGNGQSGRVDGHITLGENIADNTGIVQTLRAFLRYALTGAVCTLRETGVEPH
jgi:hypothetical protein